MSKPMKNDCGSYFCERCGDCLHCYGDLQCYDGADHQYPAGTEEDCDHEGHVVKGECEKCGERGLESDAEIYEKEAPR